MNNLNHLNPQQNLLRLIYIRTLSICKPVEEFATWLLTGEAVILGAIIVNVETISKVLSSLNLSWGIALLVSSLLAGVITKQLGLAICAGLALNEQILEELDSPEGLVAIKGMIDSPEEFKQELLSAFLPPLRGIMKRSFDRGSKDPLSGEKKLTFFLSIQLYSFWTQCILGTAGLLVLGFGIKSSLAL
ncbi:MAG: hypothetical protein ACXV8O_05740 [Methylobacter sp.]